MKSSEIRLNETAIYPSLKLTNKIMLNDINYNFYKYLNVTRNSKGDTFVFNAGEGNILKFDPNGKKIDGICLFFHLLTF